MHPLEENDSFADYSMLVLDAQGRFVNKGKSPDDADTVVSTNTLAEYLLRKIVLPTEVTDVVVWVHGWQNDLASANRSARRLFAGIKKVYEARAEHYPHLRTFTPGFVAVHWPSMSAPTPMGYKRIRDRAKAMTEKGYAEFFLASLLGYLSQQEPPESWTAPGTLRSDRGFCVHCVGHSFGGRFLTAAIGAAAAPKSPKTLSLLQDIPDRSRGLLAAGVNESERFAFTVDSLAVFQMAAPHSSFGTQLGKLIDAAPLRGPVALTNSRHDRANCTWHRFTEWGERAIGCAGATQPRSRLHAINLHSLEQSYTVEDFPPGRITNVDATHGFTQASKWTVEGAHSDYWYEESVHLLLGVMDAARSNPQ